jgi:glycine cleavage system aminomethyltransferase T/glycine/D-amino acid oxidase-like deaminating enzyme
MTGRAYVVIGAGVVGAAVADQLTARGATDVTVLDKGPLYATGGSSSHAPGLVSRTSPSKMMQTLADYTVDTFTALDLDGAPAMLPVGTLEVARNEPRLRELQRRWNATTAWGFRGRMVEPGEIAALWPIIDTTRLVGGYVTEGEGLAVALRAVEAQARRAIGRGARFVGDTEVTGIEHRDGRVTGVRVGGEVIPADVVVCAAGVWGSTVASMVGLTLPMLALEHQYAVTGPVPALAANAGNDATMPIVRHHDAGLYYRDHGDRVGIGSFNHRRLPVAATVLDSHERREDGIVFAFTPEDFAEPWQLTCELMPALREVTLERSFNGVFAFTPDGYPLVGEHPDLRGFWVGESVWVTHSAGVGRVLAETIIDGSPSIDASPAELSRFERPELDPAVFEARCDDSYRDVYAVHHPAEGHTSARDLRFSPFEPRQRALGAAFFDIAAWERPRWYEANASLVDAATVPPRDEWSSRYWSPIAIAEHLAVRERAGVFDMTALTRIEVRGPGAGGFLAWMVAGRVDRPVGTVTYSLLLDPRGGIRSDVTVARVADDRFVIGANGPRDLAWLRRHLPPDDSVTVTDLTGSVCCLGLWGPAARDILAPVADGDLAFGYLRVGELRVKGIPVTAMRVSYAGEMGWELTAAFDDGLALWDALMASGERYGVIAAGAAALSSLRIEKGYRMWGADMTPEHTPAQAGLGFTVRTDDADFLGRDGLAARAPATQRLATLTVEPDIVMTGGEPLFVAGQVAGYVTSAAYGPSVGRSIAYAWVPDGLEAGDAVMVRSFDREVQGTVAPGPALFDPAGVRLRA